MDLPPLLVLADEAAYKAHWIQRYVTPGSVKTFDGIDVRFFAGNFDHAFFTEVVRGSGKKTNLIGFVLKGWIGFPWFYLTAMLNYIDASCRIGSYEGLHWFQARVMPSSHRWRGMEIEPNLLPRTQSTALLPWVR